MHSFSFEFWSCVEDCLLPKCRHAWWPDITLIYFFTFARSIRPSNFQAIVWQFLHNFFFQRPTWCQPIDYSAEKVKSQRIRKRVVENFECQSTSTITWCKRAHSELRTRIGEWTSKSEEFAVWSSHLVWQLSWAEQELQKYQQELQWSSIFEPCITE